MTCWEEFHFDILNKKEPYMTLLTRKNVVRGMLGRVSYDILNKKECNMTYSTRKRAI